MALSHTLLVIAFLSVAGVALSSSVSGIFPSNFRVSASGTTIDGSSFDITNNTGTLSIDGVSYTALAYWTQVMDTYGIRPSSVWWINVVGIAEDGSNLAIVYLDCTGGVLGSDYWEEDWNTFLASTYIESEYVGQNCHFSLEDWSINVTMPLLTEVPSSSIDTGITITGDSINFNSNMGWMVYQGSNYTIMPISTVNCWDCASNCGSYDSVNPSSDAGPYCEPGPWYEIHHAAYTKSSTGDSTICFGIFYLFHHDHSFVQWNYTFCSPSLSSPMELYSDVDWEGTLTRNLRTEATWEFKKDSSHASVNKPPIDIAAVSSGVLSHGDENVRKPMKEPRRERGWREMQ